MSTSTCLSKKSERNVIGNSEDHISNLPEGVLDLILYFLTTKEVVRTCVLSKYWECKWTFTCNIVIDEAEFFCGKKSVEVFFIEESARKFFFDFVERTLLISPKIKNFSLSLKKPRMSTWISTLFSSNVETIKVSCPHKGIILPDILFSSMSLRNLKLKLPCTIKASPFNLLPNLTTLYLHQVEIQNENSNTVTLKFAFPILETFVLQQCEWLNVKFVEFYVPSLTKFTPATFYQAGVDDYSIKIVGAKLTKFQASSDFLKLYCE